MAAFLRPLQEAKGKKAGGGGKKGKKGGKGQRQDEEEATAGVGPKLKPCPSFFRFFIHSSSAQRQVKQSQAVTQAQREAAALLEKLQKQAEALQEEEDEVELVSIPS
jgi:hypothetical protein